MKRALVTGGGTRVGRALCEGLLADGYDLVVTVHRSRSGAEQLATNARNQGRQVTIVEADLSHLEHIPDIAAAVDTCGAALDLLVHNAGLFEKVPFEDITPDAYRRMQAVNLQAPFFLTQALLPALRRAPRPLVVMLTDIAGERPYAQYAHYSVSKAGLIMLVRALAVELGPDIRVNGISLGAVLFPDDWSDAQKARVLASIPLGREGRVEDVTGALRYLLDATYVTGQLLTVDGGRSARR